MKKVRYAIVGFGGIAENRIAKEGFAVDRKRFKPHPRAVLIGATDISFSRKTSVEALGLKWFPSAESIWQSPDIEAVFIATNNGSHFSLAKHALEAGKHVIVEKPMAAKLEDAEKLIALAEKKNLSLSVDHMMVHNAFNRKSRDLISRGALGEVNDLCLHMEFCFGSTPEEAATWRCAEVAEIGGPIGDVGSHCLYMAEFLTGSPVCSVSAVFTPRTLLICAENGAYIRFRLANGLSGSARVSFNDQRGNLESLLLSLGYEVYGTKKTLKAFGTLFQLSGHPDEPVKIKLEISSRGISRNIPAGNIKNIYQEVIREHAEAVMSGRRLTGRDGLHNLRLVLAAYESAGNSGKEVDIAHAQ